MRAGQGSAIGHLQEEIVACRRCERLVAHCRAIAVAKRRAYRDWDYWGRPVPSFGDPDARLVLVGLAPGAHGANRTGRVFTGDSSGDFLYRALFEAGFASQPGSLRRGDGQALRDCYICCAVRCAPPKNRPTSSESASCLPFLVRELELMRRLRVAVPLGHFAHRALLAALRARGATLRAKDIPFRHGRRHSLPAGFPDIVCSYHPSQQNTRTGRLTPVMMRDVFRTVRGILEGWNGRPLPPEGKKY